MSDEEVECLARETEETTTERAKTQEKLKTLEEGQRRLRRLQRLRGLPKNGSRNEVVTRDALLSQKASQSNGDPFQAETEAASKTSSEEATPPTPARVSLNEPPISPFRAKFAFN